jgi:hypothetical protein
MTGMDDGCRKRILLRHFLHTGTIWVHGPSGEVPTTEMQPRRPFGEYGIEKERIEAYLPQMDSLWNQTSIGADVSRDRRSRRRRRARSVGQRQQLS